MKRSEYAAKKGITVEKLMQEEMEFLQNEGYDDAGNEYDTLDAWIDRKPIQDPIDPYDGGRGAGQMGNIDY